MNVNIFGKIILYVCVPAVFFATGCKVVSNMSEGEAEQEVFQLVNEYRISIQLNRLTWDEAIARECRAHSENMADGNTDVGHEGYRARFDNICAAIPNAVFFGENVAHISSHPEPAQYALDLWLANATHRANIEGNFGLTGVGVAKSESGEFYITQIFIRIE